MRANSQAISKVTFVSYGLLGLPLALLAITYFVYLPKFYSDVVGLSLGSIGTLLLVSRLWDAFTDPLIGSFSDRSTSRFGRRRTWIALAALPLAVSFFFLLSPQYRPDYMSAGAWFLGGSFFFFLFWTMVAVPYEALGAELSGDYNERTKLLSFRDGAIVLGTLLSGVIPAIMFPQQVSEIGGYTTLALLYAGLVLAAATLCLWATPEPKWSEQQRAQVPLLSGLREVLANRPFRILLLSYTIAAFGAGLPPVLLPFYVDYVLGADDPSIFLVLYFLIGFLCLPLWVKLSRRWGKKEAWIAAMLLNTGAFVGVYFLGAGDLLAYGILVSISGVGYGASLALPSSMQADVIDYDELQHGHRREGQFVGFWSIAKKLAAALGGGIALTALDFSGYQANQEQNETTIEMLRLLYAGVPCLCNFVAIAIAYQYPISETRYQEIRRQLEEREAREQ